MVRSIDRPDMTLAVDWDVKNQTKQKNNHIVIYLVLSSERY